MEQTLILMHRWGYAPILETLAENLLGGCAGAEDLRWAISRTERIRQVNGFVCLRGWEHLLEPSQRRIAIDRNLTEAARTIARQFARDLVKVCPFVEAVALTGSVAAGAYEPGDDIDFDLVVRTGTKYLCYLVANVVGLKYAWRHRDLDMKTVHRTPLVPKVTCINVVWPTDQTRPFVRQDAGLAFELLRCQPLVGSERFDGILRDNPWLRGFFPQLYERVRFNSVTVESSPISRFLASLQSRPRLLRIAEAASRRLAWVLYHFVQSTRERNPEARERMDFLRRVKYPYEVFQD